MRAEKSSHFKRIAMDPLLCAQARHHPNRSRFYVADADADADAVVVVFPSFSSQIFAYIFQCSIQ